MWSGFSGQLQPLPRMRGTTPERAPTESPELIDPWLDGVALLQSPIQHRTRLPRAERDAYILRLRAAGHTHSTIAAEVGCGVATVQRVLQRHLQELQQEIRHQAAAIRAQHLLELRWLREQLTAAVSRGEVAAIGRWIQIQERESRLLGLDAPPNLDAAASAWGARTVLQQLADQLPAEVMDQIVAALTDEP